MRDERRERLRAVLMVDAGRKRCRWYIKRYELITQGRRCCERGGRKKATIIVRPVDYSASPIAEQGLMAMACSPTWLCQPGFL